MNFSNTIYILFFGAVLLIFGVVLLLRPAFAWRLQEVENDWDGVESNETELWNFRLLFGSLSTIVLGIVMIVVGVSRLNNELTERNRDGLVRSLDFSCSQKGVSIKNGSQEWVFVSPVTGENELDSLFDKKIEISGSPLKFLVDDTVQNIDSSTPNSFSVGIKPNESTVIIPSEIVTHNCMLDSSNQLLQQCKYFKFYLQISDQKRLTPKVDSWVICPLNP